MTFAGCITLDASVCTLEAIPTVLSPLIVHCRLFDFEAPFEHPGAARVTLH